MNVMWCYCSLISLRQQVEAHTIGHKHSMATLLLIYLSSFFIGIVGTWHNTNNYQFCFLRNLGTTYNDIIWSPRLSVYVTISKSIVNCICDDIVHLILPMILRHLILFPPYPVMWRLKNIPQLYFYSHYAVGDSYTLIGAQRSSV